MKLHLYPVILLLAGPLFLRAQEPLFVVSPQQLQTDSLSLYEVAGYVCDPSGQLSLEEVQRQTFSPLTEIPSRRFETKKVYWIHFRVDNRAGTDSLFFTIFSYSPFRTTIFQVIGKEVVRKRSGQVNRPGRGFLGDYDMTSWEVPPGAEAAFYLQVDDRPYRFRIKSRQIQLALISPEFSKTLVERNTLTIQDFKISNAAFLAVLLFLVIFTGAMYAQSREPVYLHYALYIFIIFVYYLIRRSNVLHTPFSYLNAWRMHAEVPLSFAIFLGYLNFIRAFLDVSVRQHPRLAKTLQIGSLLVALVLGGYVVTSFLLPFFRIQEVFLWIRAVLFIAGGWVIFRVFQEGGRLGRFIIGGTFALVAGGLLLLVNDLIRKHAGVNIQYVPLSYTQAGILAEAFIFALGLGYRTRMIKEEKTLAEIRALKAQLNPHFIFNSLNSIKDLIQKNRSDEAVSYLTKFGKLMRGILHHSDDMRVPAEEELEMCRSYLTLESLRFDHRFHFEVKAEPDLLDFPVPPLIFQPFLENAIWHGLLPKTEGDRWVRLELMQKKGRVIGRIEDNGVGRVGSEKPEGGAGIRLVRERLQRLYPEAEVVFFDKFDTFGKPEGTIVEIEIPKT